MVKKNLILSFNYSKYNKNNFPKYLIFSIINISIFYKIYTFFFFLIIIK